jgi:GNAT superfamily N-acetyltransferase
MSATTTTPAVHGVPRPRPRSDREVPTSVLTLAFAGDPVMRWFWPDASVYVSAFTTMAELLGAPAVAAGTVDALPGGAALWVPSDAELPEEQLGELLESTVPPSRLADAFSFLQQVAERHPTAVHWYLPLIGVDPVAQGQGRGSVLLSEGLRRCGRDRMPAYLEASSARNRALYQRHGFAVVDEIRAGDSPPLWPMWRPAA